MPRAELEAKARDLLTPRMGKDRAGRLIDAIFNIESVKNVRELRPLLQV
jgi:hypothetical protein